jgi:hypothetical protein
MGRFKSVERAPAGRVVQINLRGKAYEATYRIDGPMITVDTLLFGTKRQLVGDNAPDALAKLLLAELIDEALCNNATRFAGS